MACAAWALGESDVDIADATLGWESWVESGRDVVLHDALCPMTPPAFISACLDLARRSGRPVVGVRPVTDTVKVVDDGRVGRTLERESLVAVTSPLVIPASVAAQLAGRPSDELARAVADLAADGHRAETLPAPSEGRRVSSRDDVRLLDALTTAQG